MNSFGLDIGATSMKIIWLDQQKNIYHLKSLLTTVTPAKGMQSESAADQQEIAQAIQRLVVESKITTKNVNIALPENQVFTKVIEMPSLSDKELSSAINWEAEQHIPAKLNTLTLDYKVLRRKTNTGKMEVLLVGAPIDLVHRYQQILELAGLSVYVLETEMLSTIRSLMAPNTQAVSLIVNLGALSTTLAIMQSGTVIFTYNIPLGGLAMDRAIASNFGFTLQQAEEYKKTYGINDQSLGGKITLALDPILKALLTEVKKALTYYGEKYKNETPLSQIVLTGGTALLPGLNVFFAGNTGIETVIGNPFKMVPMTGVPPELIEQGPHFSVAMGLAMRENE